MNQKAFVLFLSVFIFAFSSVSGVDGQPPDPNEGVLRLNLVPFPKQIQFQDGEFDLSRRLVIGTGTENGTVLATLVANELERAGYREFEFDTLKSAGPALCIFTEGAPLLPQPEYGETFLEQGDRLRNQGYLLRIEPNAVGIQAPAEEGLVYGVQTLCQLIRANRRENNLPCLSIQDYPSIGWRAFQDDLTRGPSTKLDFLKREMALGSYLKMNIFTYYMEYQFEHPKHPKIGPKDGSLTSQELREMVEYGEPLHMNVLGNQQSFGHFERILSIEDYASLRENARVITPAKEETYRLLDDLYADQIPYLPFPFFNVCCDETEGIGEGPAKQMVEELGVDGTYVKHIQRLHEIVKGKYGKRMMMWGDIILNHPDRLKEIPSDVVMMTWAYDARENFESQIVPFAESGFEFFVCPGASDWNVILPDFQTANTNIQHFVRDGYKHGCLGTLITDWDDDGRTFNAQNVYEYAWGAECAWNASTTPWEDFNRRVGRVLFGPEGGEFGQAIQHLLPVGGVPISLYFEPSWEPIACESIDQKRKELEETDRLKAIRSAAPIFKHVQRQAVVNGDLLDAFLFGAERLALVDEREKDRFEAAVAYRNAEGLPVPKARLEIAKAVGCLQRARDAYLASRDRYVELWNRENKPYALSWGIEGGPGTYNGILSKYDSVISRLQELSEKEGPLPPAAELGLEIEVTAK